MSYDIALPNISSVNDKERINQIHSYLYQLSEQLKWALNSMEIEAQRNQQNIEVTLQESIKNAGVSDPKATFNSLKSLIISSAEIVDAYGTELKKKYDGVYLAQSEFGQFEETTSQTVTENSKSIESLFTNVQKIESKVEGIDDSFVDIKANIRCGMLGEVNGVPMYGIEVGQKTEKDGVEIFRKYARFTSGRLSFYDNNDIEVAYISDYKLYITHATITGSLKIGRFVLDTSNGLTCKWE
jgi:hypothetical protein